MRRVRVTFWLLVAVAIVSTGTLMRAVTWPANPATGITVAGAGIATAAAVGLAVRILIVTGRGH